MAKYSQRNYTKILGVWIPDRLVSATIVGSALAAVIGATLLPRIWGVGLLFGLAAVLAASNWYLRKRTRRG